jgi:CheY-like chemotaxis protein
MMGDREKCIEAGASDYIAKPVNTLELMTMLKSWLTR